MTKWADFLISKVCYDDSHKRIKKVEVHTDDGTYVHPAGQVDRLIVVSNLKKGLTYMTVRNGTNGWKQGDKVIPYAVDDEYFIRTDGNKIKEDNLGELPEFQC